MSAIDVTVRDIYAAEDVARAIRAGTGVEADSWIKTNAQLFLAINAQMVANTAIRFFVGLAVAFGIAAVLIVSVVQKSKEIGILRAMGASRGQILRVFLLQALRSGWRARSPAARAGRGRDPAVARAHAQPGRHAALPARARPAPLRRRHAARDADRAGCGLRPRAARLAHGPGGGDPWLSRFCASPRFASYNPGTPTEVEVLHGVDLELHAREFCALMGPSGSGKSTLLNIMGLLDHPTSGRLFLNAAEATGLDDRALTRLRGRGIGFVFQYHHLIPAFSAHENVLMPMLVDRGRPDARMRARADELLSSVGLARWRDNPANKLSGGQQRAWPWRARSPWIRRSFSRTSHTGNLDTKSAQGVFDLLREASRSRGTTVLFVTHNHALAGQCDRVIELVDGRIIKNGTGR